MYKTEAEFLKRYNIHDYDVPLASVDLAIFTLVDGELQVLLVERADYPQKGRWALPGGFVDVRADTSLDETAKRKLREKTGVSTPYVEQVCTVGSPDRDPRGWSLTVVYMALISHAPTIAYIELEKGAQWWPWTEVRKLNLAFDHQQLLEKARERLKSKTAYTALPVFVLRSPFTLTGLQKAFEELLDAPLEKKSFRRRIEEAGLLEEVGEAIPEGGRGRPAALFRPKAQASEYVFSRVLGASQD